MRQKTKGKPNIAPSERSFKRGLATSGISKNVSNKVWEWYNPPEIKKQQSNNS